MTDFELFIEANGLRKKDLADYIGSSPQYITQLCNGTRRLSQDKIALLKQNTMGWDTSMLQVDTPTTSISAKATGNGSAKVSIGSHNALSPTHAAELSEQATRIAVLEKENEMLREQLEFMKTLIKNIN